MRIAIVGMGPYGICVLETLLRHLRADGRERVEIVVIDPQSPGPGVHATDLPDFLLLNTVAGQLDLFGSRQAGAACPPSPLSFLEWLDRSGYRIDPGGRAAPGGAGRPVSPDDFLPRRLFGLYLRWVYAYLVRTRPDGVEVRHLDSEALAIRPGGGATELVELADGHRLCTDHVFICTGHTANDERVAGIAYRSPYPVTGSIAHLRPHAPIAVEGCGLVAIDVVTALTTGRGGTFHADRDGARLRYRPSGREPRIAIYSRNALPPLCRPVASRDQTGTYVPQIFTPETIRQCRRAAIGGLDMRRDVLPLLFAEMSIHFYEHHAKLARAADADNVAAHLGKAWRNGSLVGALNRYADRYGAFTPESLLFGPAAPVPTTSAEAQAAFVDLVRTDVEESRKGEAFSPLKATAELFRVLRDTIRFVVEGDVLSSRSKADVSTTIASLINRVVVGPPVQRGLELLALIEAGIVTVPFGRAPRVASLTGTGRYRISSTELEIPFELDVDTIVAGRLEPPHVDRSRSRLLVQLYRDGRLRPFLRPGPGSGVDVDDDGRAIGIDGLSSPRLSVLGPLTEGRRYFTYYVPSPKSRFRAFRDADRAVATALAQCRRDAEHVPAKVTGTVA